ncbi:MAG: DUF2807 domain-containing protein [Ichthyobacteriaceae bacterium]|nr:DUF2807 domain-containing protein [Ichthyobacteriaceae bacterium]
MKKLILSLFIITSVLSSCNDENVKGTGDLSEQERTLASFNEINSSISADVNITYSEKQTVSVTADENIINDLKTVVTNNKLVIEFKDKSYSNTNITINITLPYIDKITLSGEGHYSITEFSDFKKLKVINSGSMYLNIADLNLFQTLDITNSGEFNFTAVGSVKKLQLTNSGKQTVKCFDFESEKCVIISSGSGKTEINVKDNLDITNSGSEDFYYKGVPGIVIKSTGSGEIVGIGN